MTKRKLPIVTVADRPAVKTEFAASAIKAWNPDLKAMEGDAAANTILIMDVIGEDFRGDGITAKNVGSQLRRFGPDADIEVLINSPGGDFFEGLAIYNVLREHRGSVTIKILGMAASAASIIAMAGDDILIAQASFIMIHNTSVLVAGDRHAFREIADWLEPFDLALSGVYEARTGMSREEISAMLDKETWIVGSDAIEQGFADDFLSSDEIGSGIDNRTGLSPSAAQKKLDILLAQSNVTKSERRDLFAALKGGKSRAAPSGTSRAAAKNAGARKLLETLNKI